MIRRSKHLEALLRKHWRAIIGGKSGIWLDGYNCAINTKTNGTITTRLDTSNQYFITDTRKCKFP